MRRLTLSIVSVALVVACIVSTAYAAEATYSSNPFRVARWNGPTQSPIDINWAENNSGTGICSRIWENASEKDVASICEPKPWFAVTTYASCGLMGHGTAARYYKKYEYILSGYQHWNGCV